MSTFSCPLPNTQYQSVVLAHGGGGRLMHQLIDSVFKPAFDSPALAQLHDGAILEVGGLKFAFTTDAHVVKPIFFPGGDIGKLSVCGTVNDLAVCGAKPLYLSAAFILEEGFPIVHLTKLVDSMREVASKVGVEVTTGDTKVVERGRGDGVYIMTSGIGFIGTGEALLPSRIMEGDAIIISGDIGRHGIAVLSVREGLEFETTIESDVAPVWDQVAELLNARVPVHCMRDLTRGGLGSALNELATASHKKFEIYEEAVPVSDPVKAACEILGFDPINVACEGRFVVFVPSEFANHVVELLSPWGFGPSIIGHVEKADVPCVVMQTRSGVRRIVEMPAGEQLPRIC